MSGRPWSVSNRPVGSQRPWSFLLDCGHVVLFSIHPEYMDEVWCVRCEGPTWVQGLAEPEWVPRLPGQIVTEKAVITG